MAQKKRGSLQKVELHGRGVGGFSQGDVECRARELALIDGRTDVIETDRARAIDEFRDGNLPDAINEDVETTQSRSPNPGDLTSDCGRRLPNYGDEDEKTVLEQLALEGVEEAQHEQMVEARRHEADRSPLRLRRSPEGG